MSLDSVFREQKGVYMAHVYYGDPTESFSSDLIQTLCENGVDIIEFGIPFSDPTSDGVVFQRACERALKAGMTPSKAIAGIGKLRAEGMDKPIVVTSYYNPILFMGVDDFMRRIASAGADALIVPNVPFEEADELLDAGKEHDIDIIFLIAPTTPERRLEEILKRAGGFVYVVTITGVTGARDDLGSSTLELVKRVRRHTDIPLLAGFGISKGEHARSVVAAGADGAITGSVLGSIYEADLEYPNSTLQELANKAGEIKQGCIEGHRQRQEAI